MGGITCNKLEIKDDTQVRKSRCLVFVQVSKRSDFSEQKVFVPNLPKKIGHFSFFI